MKRALSLIIALMLMMCLCSNAFAVTAQYSSTQLFLNLLDEKDVSYTYVGIDDQDYEKVEVKNTDSEAGISYTLLYYFDPNNENAGIRVWDVAVFGDDATSKLGALLACNNCNSAWKYITFFVEDDNTVTAKMDLIYRGETVSEVVWEATLHMVNVLCDAYLEYLGAIDTAE